MLKNKLSDSSFYFDSSLAKIFSDSPLGFIDVGARGGMHALVEPIHDYVSFLGFEPDRAECSALNANQDLQNYWREFRVLPHALANDYGKKELHLVSALTNTSLLQPNKIFVDRYNMHAKWQVTGKCELEVMPLDDIVADPTLSIAQNAGEMMKLDTQGSEFDILQGAKKLLTERCMCVVTEVEFFEIYEEQKLFSDVELLLRQLGFAFYGFLTLHTRSKKLLNKATHVGRERLFYADAVFFKDPFVKPQTFSPRQLYVLILAAILTGYFDFALELIASSQLNLPPKDKGQLEKLVRDVAYVDPHTTKTKVSSLLAAIETDTERGNLHLGKFIDNIHFPDFEDINL